MPTPARRRRRRLPARARTAPVSPPRPPAALYLRGFPTDLAESLHTLAVMRRTTIGALVIEAIRARPLRSDEHYPPPQQVALHLRGLPADLAHALRIEAARRKLRIGELLDPHLRTWLRDQATRAPTPPRPQKRTTRK